MDKILDRIGDAIEKITEPERVEKMLELTIRLVEVYARIKGV